MAVGLGPVDDGVGTTVTGGVGSTVGLGLDDGDGLAGGGSAAGGLDRPQPTRVSSSVSATAIVRSLGMAHLAAVVSGRLLEHRQSKTLDPYRPFPEATGPFGQDSRPRPQRAQAGGLPDAVLALIATARTYAEGRAVRMTVRGVADVDVVEQLAAVKAGLPAAR